MPEWEKKSGENMQVMSLWYNFEILSHLALPKLYPDCI